MKAFRIIMVLALLAIAIGVAPNQASAGAFTYTSGIQIQNLENSKASITVQFFPQGGGTPVSVGKSIDPLSKITLFPLTDVSEGFNGSVVISSDKAVASVSNIHGNNMAANASYIAASSGNTTVQIPLLMKGNSGYNTWFNVQNTDTSAAADVTVNYSDGTTANANIAPGAAHTFDQSLESHPGKVFSASVTSAKPLAVTVIEESTKLMFAYNGVAAGSANPVMPLINANNSGYTTGIQIQNTGSQETSVTVSYIPAQAGTACTEKQTIPAGQSKTFALVAFAQNISDETCAAGARFIGSARVSANTNAQPLVAVVNQHRLGLNGEAYGGFNVDDATNTVVLPLIMDRNGGYWTGFNVMNIGAAQVDVKCTFTGTIYTASATLDPGEALSDQQVNRIADRYVGSGTCVANTVGTTTLDPNGKIVAVVNELGPSGSADQLLVYEGINP